MIKNLLALVLLVASLASAQVPGVPFGGSSASSGDSFWSDAGIPYGSVTTTQTGFIAPTNAATIGNGGLDGGYVLLGGVWLGLDSIDFAQNGRPSSAADMYAGKIFRWWQPSTTPFDKAGQLYASIEGNTSGIMEFRARLGVFDMRDRSGSASSELYVGTLQAGGTSGGATGFGYVQGTGTKIRTGNGTDAYLVSDGTGTGTPSYLYALSQQLTGTTLTSLPAAGAGLSKLMETDTESGHLWYRPTTANGSTPWTDLASDNSVLGQREYIIDVDNGGNGAMTFAVAPRYAGATLTIATVDGAAASFGTGGIGGGIVKPYIWHFRNLTTTAVANNTSTMTSSANFIQAGVDAPWFCQRVSIGATQTSMRVWTGLMSALPGSSDAPGGDYIAFRYSTAAGDTTWQYCVGDSSGATQSCTTTTVAPTSNAPDLLCADNREGSAVTFWVNGTARGRLTSGVPAFGNTMKPVNHLEALAASIRAVQFGRIAIKVN